MRLMRSYVLDSSRHDKECAGIATDLTLDSHVLDVSLVLQPHPATLACAGLEYHIEPFCY